MTTTDDLPRWSVTDLHESFDSRSFIDAMERTGADASRLEALFEQHGIRAVEARAATADDGVAADAVVAALNDFHAHSELLEAYIYATTSTNSFDERAQALMAEYEMTSTRVRPLTARFAAWVASLGVDSLAHVSPAVAEHREPLAKLAARSEHQMSEAEEGLYAALLASGSSAWGQLQHTVTSQLTTTVHMPDGTTPTLPMAAVRGLASNADAAVRKAAYEGELAAWEGAAVAFAAALNGAKGTLGVLNTRRGHTDDLAPVLRSNNVDRATLDAMTSAVVGSLPDFRRYLRAKARLLGHANGLPWYDLFAPLRGGTGVSWDDATALVASAFDGYSSHLGALAHRAFSERWIDAEIRDGKRSGAYCADIQGDISRIMMNFDGSHDAVSTLAHELGHAYHNTTLAIRTPIQRRLPMALAETASIFCETLLFEHLRATATAPAQRLSLLETHLGGAAQVVVDIHSRFLFETELCRRRRRTALSVAELNATMLDAQDAAYGDGLDPALRHPYMWAVKAHYFTAFYNWPYTFGLLFGIGLFAQHRSDPESFRAGYDDLLSSAGMADAVSLGSRFGIDVRDAAFWESSLDVLRAQIDDYEALAADVEIAPDAASNS